jgi:hypothetical protein
MRKTPETPITLEELLKLKRHEKPQEGFWDRFDRDFETRRLRALMREEEPGLLAAGRGWWRSLVLASGALAALLVATATVFRAPSSWGWWAGYIGAEATADSPLGGDAQVNAADSLLAKEGTLMVARQLPFEAEALFEAESRFVLDVIPAEFEQHHFRRVMANPAFMGVGPAGAEFVADALMSSGRSRATFAVDRPLGQF